MERTISKQTKGEYLSFPEVQARLALEQKKYPQLDVRLHIDHKNHLAWIEYHDPVLTQRIDMAVGKVERKKIMKEMESLKKFFKIR